MTTPHFLLTLALGWAILAALYGTVAVAVRRTGAIDPMCEAGAGVFAAAALLFLIPGLTLAALT